LINRSNTFHLANISDSPQARSTRFAPLFWKRGDESVKSDRIEHDSGVSLPVIPLATNFLTEPSFSQNSSKKTFTPFPGRVSFSEHPSGFRPPFSFFQFPVILPQQFQFFVNYFLLLKFNSVNLLFVLVQEYDNH
ncbi:hypothetical protein, partial [Sunxiuqinia rutila]|uniref:hypothetical protein n=1 Tax=Sunxiuqinia rutila TaxID=1397841 RepID=UPI003D369E96